MMFVIQNVKRGSGVAGEEAKVGLRSTSRGTATMGHSKESKRETHEKVIRAAAKRFREAGIEGIGIADLMKEVGLTVGGFYKHFESRDDLVAEALEVTPTLWDPILAKAKVK